MTDKGVAQQRGRDRRRKTAAALGAMLDGEAETIARKAVELALAGDMRRSGCALIESCRHARTGL